MKREWRLQAHESVERTREPQKDGWDNGDFNTEIDCIAVHFIDKNARGGMDYHCIDAWSDNFPLPNIDIDNPPKNVYVVISRYSTGSTFGHHSGLFSVEGIFDRDSEAEEFEKNNQQAFKKKHSGYFGGFQYSQIEHLPLYVK